MQTFLFHELTRRAKDAAVSKYQEEQIVEEYIRNYRRKTRGDCPDTIDEIDIMFSSFQWRYSEHGERIA